MFAETLDCPEPEIVECPDTRPILIVEDDPSIAEVLSIRLEHQGFQTLTAHNGHTGLELARRRHPRLVLLDLHLPDIDGFHVCRELEKSSETNGIPIIILSGMERPDIIRRSRAAGCSYFVRKPYDPNALLVLIESALWEAGT